MALTKRQGEVFEFIKGFIAAKGYSPSFEEIGEGMQLSSLATVHKHVSNLEGKGVIRRDFNRARSIDVVTRDFQRDINQRKRFQQVLLRYIAKSHPRFIEVESALWRAAR